MNPSLEQTGKKNLNFCSVLAFAVWKVNTSWFTQDGLSNAISCQTSQRKMEVYYAIGVNHGKTCQWFQELFNDTGGEHRGDYMVL